MSSPRPPRRRISPHLPPIPLSDAEMRDIWDAIVRFPITGSPLLDYRLLLLTGVLESGFQSPTITPPNGESSALGYFQIIKSVRNTISRRLNIPWDNTMATQALFAAYGYNELSRMLRKRSIPMFSFLPDPLANFLANVRFRYVVGTGAKYFNHRDAKSFMTKLMKNYSFLAQGDASGSPLRVPSSVIIPSNVKWMHPVFRKEFMELPLPVKSTFVNICRSFDDANIFVSSIKSSMTGDARTMLNGPNHADHKAIDFVITPFDSPYFKDQTGAVRSPQFHWNEYLLSHLVSLFKKDLVTASVLVEPDHIHIDSNHEPSISVKLGDKAIYPNLRCSHRVGTQIKRLHPIK